MTDVMHIVGQEQFKTEVLEFDGVVLVDFYADRCGPCRMLGPIMEELTEDNAGKNAKIVKVNVDENQEVAAAFQVASIPAVFLVKGGKPVDSVVGVSPKTVYQEKIDALLE